MNFSEEIIEYLLAKHDKGYINIDTMSTGDLIVIGCQDIYASASVYRVLADAMGDPDDVQPISNYNDYYVAVINLRHGKDNYNTVAMMATGITTLDCWSASHLGVESIKDNCVLLFKQNANVEEIRKSLLKSGELGGDEVDSPIELMPLEKFLNTYADISMANVATQTVAAITSIKPNCFIMI